MKSQRFKDVMVQKVDKNWKLVLKEKMAQALAANTNYAAMISGPSYHKTKLKIHTAFQSGSK